MIRDMKAARHYLIKGPGLSLLAFGLTLLLATITPITSLDLKGLDYLFVLRGALAPPENIVIVAIDEPSFAELGLQWPWPRSLHARLIGKLKEAGARVIGFDILFVEPSEPLEDRALAKAMARAGNVILVSDISVTQERLFRHTIRVEPLPPFKQAAAGVGLASIRPDPDAFIRRAFPVIDEDPSFALGVARLYSDRSLESGLKEIVINFHGPPRTFRTVSYYQALDYERSLPPGLFQGKIVLVGRSVTASPEPDKPSPEIFTTPFGNMAGVEIHANILNNLLKGNQILTLRSGQRLALLMLLTLLAGLAIAAFSPLAALGVIGAVALVYEGGAFFLFAGHRLWMPTFTPLVSLALTYAFQTLHEYTTVERERRRIRKTFSRYMAPAILKEVLENPEAQELRGRQVEATVLFTDLAGFTSASEKLPPQEVVRLVNRYLGIVTDIIFAHRGTLDKYMGDAVMAFWGAPLADEFHALRACQAALEIIEEMEVLRKEWAGLGLPALHVRIGINSGPVVVGNVGSERHMSYTVMGDTVNIASRLEQASKDFGTQVLISEATWQGIKGAMRVREVGEIKVKGKEMPLLVYELLP